MTIQNCNSTNPLIFLHIPKAAGSTLSKIMAKNYKPSTIYTIGNPQEIEEFKRLPKEKSEKIKLLQGHFHYGLHEFLSPSANYITILRNPTQRLISLYNYVIQERGHYLHDLVISQGMKLPDFIQSNISPELYNIQTIFIAGTEALGKFEPHSKEILETAKKNLKNHFITFGLSEKFDETLLLMKRALGWKFTNLFYTRINVTKLRPQIEIVSQNTLELIQKTNKLDIELYQYAQKLFNERTRKLGLGFKIESELFKIINHMWNKHPGWRPML